MKRTSTEAHVYMRRHQDAKVKHFDISNMIYHKFSHGAVSYTLNGENVNVMLEFVFKRCMNKWLETLGQKVTVVIVILEKFDTNFCIKDT